MGGIPLISYSMNICSNTRGNRGFSAIKIAHLQSVGFLPIPLQRDIYAPRRYLCTARGAPDEPYVSSYSRACYLLSRGPGEEPVDEDVVTERETCVCGGGDGRRRGEATHLLTMCGLITNQLRLDRGAPPSPGSLTSPFIQTSLLCSFWRNLMTNLSEVQTLILDLSQFRSNIPLVKLLRTFRDR